MNPDAASPFNVSWTLRCREALTLLAAKALEKGVGPELAEALVQIRHRLETDPRDWGDPIRSLRGMSAIMYRGIANGLSVVYAVHERENVVFVRDVHPLPWHKLADGE